MRVAEIDSAVRFYGSWTRHTGQRLYAKVGPPERETTVCDECSTYEAQTEVTTARSQQDQDLPQYQDMPFTNNPHNTQLVGSNVAYSVSSTPIGQRTSIARNGAPVANFQLPALGSDLLHMGGREIKVKEFLVKEGWLSSKRRFEANGGCYTWDFSLLSHEWTLERDGRTIASCSESVLKESKLHVTEEVLPMLDLVVVTLMVLRSIQSRKKRKKVLSAGLHPG
ncbi:hypothetical protein BKA62DRAFT_832806 [Auriculariales sp. MPI-PUGE-AT-0066]|nr:hypothetical protein BKA62DRAFT_832806 [Auriculariales sp. MPI-PUGE-AT-0066]